MAAQTEHDAANFQARRRWYQSIAAKLQITFGLIVALTVGASLLAILRFNDANVVISRRTDVSLPTVKLSLALENRAAAVSNAAEDLSGASTEAERKTARDEIASRFSGLTDVLGQLKSIVGETDALQRLTNLADAMDHEINELDKTIQEKIARATSRQASVQAVASATDLLITFLGPAGDTVITTIRQAVDANSVGDDRLRTVIRQNLPTLRALYDTRTDIVGVANVLNLAASATSADQIPPLSNQFSSLYRRIARNLEVVIADPNADAARVDEVSTTIRRLLSIGTGGNNLFDMRVQELRAITAARARQAEMLRIGGELNREVTAFVVNAENEVGRTNALLVSEIATSRWILIVISIISIVVSGLIVWQFIVRYVARNMSELAVSMLAVARGNLDATMPPVRPDELGDMSRALLVFRDNAREIREARDAAEQARLEAESASRTKSAFLANMSHELRTPLNAIIGYSDMLLEDATDRGDTTTAGDLGKIQNAGKHLLGLINDILDVSKIEAGRMEVFLEAMSVPALAEEVRTLATPLAASNQNTLSIAVEPGIDTFRTDVTKLKQSLLNLISNACKFTKNGTVGLAVSRHQGAKGEELLHFTVTDSGIGMSEEQTGKLFQPFVQADSSTTRQFGGTGLGLAITRQFCRMLGGDVEVSSQPGQGSVFKIILPVTAPESPGRAAEASEGLEAGGPMSAAAVLVVDDDPQVHDLLGAMLTREGYRVLHAANGREAMARARKEEPAAILLDIMMPQVDGWTVLSELKEDPKLASIPVVIVSMLDERPLGLSLGAAEFLTKPVDRAKLMATLAQHIPHAEGTALIVEDQEADRASMSHILKSIGMTVAEAVNGRTALEWLENHPTPAVMVLDIMMPELDGFAVLDAVRRDERLRRLPVIILTAKDLTAAELEYLRGQGGLVIHKGPDARETLLGALRRQAVME